ncbi:pantetheine-phosphate adenylyltransferase [Ilyobacter polytropus]|uniref:Phosphopantetheine adenylyltransferase n=1 Tax=Ilyobacter polytropus (strain ATCC 51220 / DSM 2926 / LMG 16218 / CuHBu1) TaxID=572544 RepID=E3H852_ILYPC|nr:pantetheine-phosphate adenylyltransferase [Ilyobacter polytropus]ADO83283.1 Phosphopantetheine adenylyltransferase [Ilyobacter polytropus DSM 2926]
MKIGVYAGSFDPITKGHEDIIRRAANLTDKLIIGILNSASKNYWFDLKERGELIKKVIGNLDNVEIMSFEGLLVDFMRKNNANIVFRGLRAVSDYEYELQMALGNSVLSGGELETVFLPASRENLYLSSSLVREVALNKGNLEHFVNKKIVEDISRKVDEMIKEGK